jgi:DNA-binding NtrC family response regulator
MELITQESFDLVLADASAPGPSGLQLLNELSSRDSAVDCVIMSAFPTVDQSVEALRRGAVDYISKPFQLYEVANVIKRLIMKRRESKDARRSVRTRGVRSLQRETYLDDGNSTGPENKTTLLGNSPAMKKVFAIVDRIALTDSSVLITGATGTGKELAARAIHERSRRANAPFIDINCSAIPDTLVESELFGHERGAFTGAHETRRGLFEEATGGTIFLDEVDALDPAAQAKLLRVVQERTLRRVGGRENIPIDVRIISATNGDLMRAIAKGKFRADLYFRLRVVPLHLPPLQERDNDISLLVNYFLQRHSERTDTTLRWLSAEAMKLLLNYSWPGNVRELENAIEYALALGTSEELGIDDLPPDILRGDVTGSGPAKPVAPVDLPLVEIEKRHITAMLQRYGGHYIKTATALGIDRRTLYRKLKQYDLASNRDPHAANILD